MAGFRGDFADCAFDFGDFGGGYDKRTAGVGGEESEVLEFELEDGCGRNLIEELLIIFHLERGMGASATIYGV